MRPRLIIIAFVLTASAVAGALYLGVYNVAASEGHSALVYHVLHYSMRRSVKSRAEDISVPGTLDDPQNISTGLRHYQRYCVQCHGAPGIAPDAIAIGMIPAPTNLVATARLWSPAELYWVIHHGIKMTAMPAWNYQMSESELWELVAFLKVLPTLSPSEYEQLYGNTATITISPQNCVLSANATVDAGSPEKGRRAIKQYLCTTCHRIPGEPGTENEVGPSLDGIGGRTYIAGVLLNTPENMVKWLCDPQAINPDSAMPNLRLSVKDAKDIAALLSQFK